ncbi:hypothetical protein L6164_026296 [Bauhinia variegata]|uniref:Uncharacterized protein n=1 Tax=Bauhinia variegata TaxID=167791 RepID=A0ACB9LPQ4_BAUVA|nr:hypothetical protein L6164_026296 [Bauhinia variegata]
MEEWDLQMEQLEATAIREAMVLLFSWGYNSVQTEGDSMGIMTFLNKNQIPRNHLGVIIEDILRSSVGFSLRTFCWVSRECNKAAHIMAWQGRNEEQIHVWMDYPRSSYSIKYIRFYLNKVKERHRRMSDFVAASLGREHMRKSVFMGDLEYPMDNTHEAAFRKKKFGFT